MNALTPLRPSRPTDAWQVEDFHEDTPKETKNEDTPQLSNEFEELLRAISKELSRNAEQMKILLQFHENQIVKAVEGTKCRPSLTPSTRPSLFEKPAKKETSVVEKPAAREMDVVEEPVFKELSVVPLPGCMEKGSIVCAPTQEAPELTPMQEMENNGNRSSLESGETGIEETDQVNYLETAVVLPAQDDDIPLKELVPEYMRARGSLLATMRKTRSTKVVINAMGGVSAFSQSGVQKCMSSKITELVVTVIIMANAFSIGLEADWTMKHISEEVPELFRVANATFNALFTVELLLRIFAYRSRFFSRRSKDFTWNLFDLFLVVSGLVDEAIALLFRTPNFTVIRMLRVSRFIRLIRVFRVLRFFQDLRIIIAGIVGAVKSMLWAAGLLLMMMYLFSICLLQLTIHEVEDMDLEARKILLKYFGSLLTAMYTLYRSITGGVDWGDAAQPLLDLNPFLAVLYSFFIAFSVLCVLNIITGVFVDNTRNICIADEEQLVIEGFENRVKWFEEVKKLFTSMVGKSGALDADHFNQFLDDVTVQACFRRLGIDVHETSRTGLFRLLDFNETGMVDLEEFALGLQSLHGSAKAIDIARIHCEIKRLKKDIHNISLHVSRGDEMFGMSHQVSFSHYGSSSHLGTMNHMGSLNHQSSMKNRMGG